MIEPLDLAMPGAFAPRNKLGITDPSALASSDRRFHGVTTCGTSDLADSRRLRLLLTCGKSIIISFRTSTTGRGSCAASTRPISRHPDLKNPSTVSSIDWPAKTT